MEMPPALVLAAGKGTRLGDLGLHTAKVLVPIDGQPVLDRHLDHLASENVSHVVVNAHHLARQIEAHVAAYRGRLRVDVAYEPTLLGTAGAAAAAMRRLGSDRLLVLYGDVLVFEPLRPLIAAHVRAGAAATLAVYEWDDLSGKGVVVTDGAGRITRFVEKGESRGPGLVNAGLYVVESSLLGPLAPDTFLDFGDDVFPAALAAGHRLQSYLLPGRVLDIGTPADLARARVFSRKRR